MRVIVPPTHDATAILDLCIASLEPLDLKTRIEAHRNTIIGFMDAFAVAAAVGSTFSLPTLRDLPDVENKEIKNLYKQGLVAQKGLARGTYANLRKSAKFNICPLCGQNPVSTLDHYLPQSRFAALVSLPINLIPACADCNRFKLARVPKSYAEQTIHPYFDDFTADQWLFAEVIELSPPAVKFFVRTPPTWKADDGLRVLRHLTTFKLDDLYTSNASNELVNIKAALDELFVEGSGVDVRAELGRRARSYFNVHRNGWQTALYQALHQSKWFWDGGFREFQ